MKHHLEKSVVMLMLLFASATQAQQTLRLVARSSSTHHHDTVFVAGSFNNWNPAGKPMQYVAGDSSWQISLNLAPGNYEFKFTRGSWDKAEATAAGTDIQNRIVQLKKDTIIFNSIAGWKDDVVQAPALHSASGHVSVLDTAFYIPQLQRYRRIWIYLPEGYGASKAKYPVIYMHDGQNLFDTQTAPYGEWAVDESMDTLIAEGKPPAIVVGIDNGPKRLQEYNPFDNSRFGKGEGDAYVEFIVETLKPFIDKKYRTKKTADFTAIAGSSMGGLISYYAALKYPETFGKAGIFSPSFWIAPEMVKLTDSLGAGMNSKLFFYIGGLEGDNYVKDMLFMAEELALNSHSLIYSVVDDEGRHNEAAWRKWFPDFYKWIMADWTNSIIDIDEEDD